MPTEGLLNAETPNREATRVKPIPRGYRGSPASVQPQVGGKDSEQMVPNTFRTAPQA